MRQTRDWPPRWKPAAARAPVAGKGENSWSYALVSIVSVGHQDAARPSPAGRIRSLYDNMMTVWQAIKQGDDHDVIVPLLSRCGRTIKFDASCGSSPAQ